MKALSLATVFAALSGFVIIWVATQTLGAAGYTVFAAYWGLFFTITGILDGLTHETTRGVASVREGAGPVSGPWLLTFLVAGVGLIAIGVSGWWWMPQLVPNDVGLATVLLAVGTASYAVQATVAGILAGRARWVPYAVLMAIDSGIRLALAFIARDLAAFLWVTVIGAGTWILLLAWTPLRSRMDVGLAKFSRGVGSAMLSSGASAVLISGFPTLLAFTASSEDAATIGALVLAITLTRAPILLPVQRFQSALISHFVRGTGSLWQPLAAVLAVGAAGGVLAWAIGPWIIRVFFNEEFVLAGSTLALLTFASGCIGALMITGAATLAMNQHRAYVTGWLVAVVVVVVLLLLPLTLIPRVVLSLILGPLAGIIIHLLSVLRT